MQPYAASKKGAEALTHSYHHLFDIDVTVVRYFTVYGPAGRPDLAIFRFVKWIMEGEPAEARPRVHLAFAATNRLEVDTFYRAALEAGGRDNGAPGLRPDYHSDYYGAFVIDPDGHNVEAVCHVPA